MNDMVDMSRFIEAKSDQLNADDLIGAPRTITVTRVAGNDGDQPVSIFYQGDNGKPFKPCKTIRRVLMGVWGRYANDYVGRSMTLYRDDRVQFGGLDVGGIRISHMSHIDKETVVVVMKSKGKKAGVKILPLQVEQQPSGLTIDDARTLITQAPDMTKLEQAWKRRDMAPFRDQLKEDLAKRKAELAEPAQASEPDPELVALSQAIIAEIEGASDIDALGEIMTRRRSDIAKLGEELGNNVWTANNKRKFELKGEAK